MTRVFARLPYPTRPGDRVQMSQDAHPDLRGRWGTVDTAHPADDLRDVKCVVELDEEPDR